MRLLPKKSTVLIIASVLLLVSGFLYLRGNNTQYSGAGLWRNYRIETRQLRNKTVRLVVAENSEQWTQGLMYVRKPVTEFDGMIFKFPDKQQRLFWNQNTLENLTIYWMADGKVLGTGELPSIEQSKKIVTVESSAPADTVIEIIK